MILERFTRRREHIEIRKYFDEIASRWDLISKEYYSESIREKMLSLFYPEPGNIIADLGAGTGFITEGLKDSPAGIIAIDQSREMLKHMKKKFRGYTNIDYRAGEAGHLPVKDNIVDYALANMYLHHVHDPGKAVTEVFRILNKGGMLIMTDMQTHESVFFREYFHDLWLGFELHEVENWLTEAGFLNVSVYPIEAYCCAGSEITDKSNTIGIFLAKGEKP